MQKTPGWLGLEPDRARVDSTMHEAEVSSNATASHCVRVTRLRKALGFGLTMLFASFLIMQPQTKAEAVSHPSDIGSVVRFKIFRCTADYDDRPSIKVIVQPFDRMPYTIGMQGNNQKTIAAPLRLLQGVYRVAIQDQHCFNNIDVAVLSGIERHISIRLGRILWSSERHAALAGKIPDIGISGIDFACNLQPDSVAAHAVIEHGAYYFTNLEPCSGSLVVHLTRQQESSSIAATPIARRLTIKNITEREILGKTGAE